MLTAPAHCALPLYCSLHSPRPVFPSMSWHVPLLLSPPPPSHLKGRPLILPLECYSQAIKSFSQIPPPPACLEFSLSLSFYFHTATQLPTPICLVIKASGPLWSNYLLLAFAANNADTAPDLIAPHVQMAPHVLFLTQ